MTYAQKNQKTTTDKNDGIMSATKKVDQFFIFPKYSNIIL